MSVSHRLWFCARVAAWLLIALVDSSSACQGDEPARLSGTLYASVFKVMPVGGDNKPRQVIAVDVATGKYRDIGCEGIAPRVEPDAQLVASWKIGPQLVPNRDDRADEVSIHDLTGKSEPFIVCQGSSVGGWVNGGKQLIVARMHHPSADNDNQWQYTNYLVHADGSASEELDMPKTDRILDCTPDGQWMLVFRGRGLWIKEAGEAKMKQIAGHTNSAFKGRLSPDGRQVSYVASSRLGDRVMIVNRDGTGAREIFKSEGVADPDDVCWSPDGRFIALSMFDWTLEGGRKILHGGEDHNCRIVFINVADKSQQVLQFEDLPLSEISDMDWQAK